MAVKKSGKPVIGFRSLGYGLNRTTDLVLKDSFLTVMKHLFDHRGFFISFFKNFISFHNGPSRAPDILSELDLLRE